MQVKMVVFDMAGTVVNEDNIVYKTLQVALNADGFTFTLEQVLTAGAGKEKLQATRDILKLHPGKFDEQQAQRIHRDFTTRLAEAYDRFPILPQPGAEKLFSELRQQGVRVVLNTGYSRPTAESLLAKLNWTDLQKTPGSVEGVVIDALVTASDTAQNRPHPDMIELAMKLFSVTDPLLVAKVGDSVIDIEEGRNAGCRFCIGVTTGAHTRRQLEAAHPDFIIDHLQELPALLA